MNSFGGLALCVLVFLGATVLFAGCFELNTHKVLDNFHSDLPIENATGCIGVSSGIYRLQISTIDPFIGLCNGDTADGGWLVIQKRFDGSENFNRSWSDYRNGFGKLNGEFFIGLDLLNRITNLERYELHIQMENFYGIHEFAGYDNFRVGNEATKYLLESLGKFNGTAFNQSQSNRKFSTWDNDNDTYISQNCAVTYSGGWWFTFFCYAANLNGRYHKNGVYKLDSINWDGFLSLKSVQMLIRPKSKV